MKKRPVQLLIKPALADVSHVEEIYGCNTTNLLPLMTLLLMSFNMRFYAGILFV